MHLFHGQHFRHATTDIFHRLTWTHSPCLRLWPVQESSCVWEGGNFELCDSGMMTYACLRTWEKGQSLAWEVLCKRFFFTFWEGNDMSNSLTYIRADRRKPGGEPMEIFICSPSCLLPGFIVISSCRFDGFNWAWLLIRKYVWLHQLLLSEAFDVEK